MTKANTRASDVSTISDIGYIVNTIGQRTSATRSGAATNSTAWGYDALGQLTSSDDSNNTADRAYQYDGIGNREKSANSLTLPGSNNYTVNALNQYTTVDSLNPVYDSDGNATSYPVPAYPSANSTLTWDAENRMISATVNSVTTNYYYDSQSRRIAQTTGSNITLYAYDSWNCIAEYTGSAAVSAALARTNLWGSDLSGSMQGAGGVGGLLATTETPASSAPVSYFPLYDGNGNITEYIDENATVIVHFNYDPFGNITNSITNNSITDNLKYRFSTKPLDSATGLYYYGYRWYDPVTGRWPSRDPICERGGVNLYGFVGNNGLSKSDFLGMLGEIIKVTEGWYIQEDLVYEFVANKKCLECCRKFVEYYGYNANFWCQNFTGRPQKKTIFVFDENPVTVRQFYAIELATAVGVAPYCHQLNIIHIVPAAVAVPQKIFKYHRNNMEPIYGPEGMFDF